MKDPVDRGGSGQWEGRIVDGKPFGKMPKSKVVSGTCVKCNAWKGELGSEPTPQLYIDHLSLVFSELRRVMRPDSVVWLNMADSYAANLSSLVRNTHDGHYSTDCERYGGKGSKVPAGMKPLDMVGIPAQVILRLRNDGWWWRSTVCWIKALSGEQSFGSTTPESVNGWRWEKCRVRVKPSERAMEGSYFHDSHSGSGSPESARDGSRFKDHSDEYADCPGCRKCDKNDGLVLVKGSWRPTSSFEYLFMLTRSGTYFGDREAVVERGSGKASGNVHHKYADREDVHDTSSGLSKISDVVWTTRNLRDSWFIGNAPSKIKHWAQFPPKLAEIPIRSSTSEWGCCPQCGSPWARVIERGGGSDDGDEGFRTCVTKCWRPTCMCGIVDRVVPAAVIDPFVGSGTTCAVAKALDRRWFGIDVHPDFSGEGKIAGERLRGSGERLFGCG